MSDFTYNESNRVFLMGTIVTEPVYSHEMFGEGFYETMLSVSRLSEHRDIIPITISERLMQERNYAVGSFLAANGQFRSYNKMTEGKSRLMLTVFVREIADGVPETANPNTIDLCGYVCKPPIYRTTPFNREICDILVAVNRAYNKSDYIPCIAWGRNARFMKGVEVGQKVSLSGRIQSREYVKKLSEELSETKTAYEISISRINLEGGGGTFSAADLGVDITRAKER